MTISSALHLRILNSLAFAIQLYGNFGIGQRLKPKPQPPNTPPQQPATDPQFVWVLPAGYAFSIWGIIYSLTALFVLYGFIPETLVQKAKGYFANARHLIVERIGYLFALTVLFNVGWLLVWNSGNLFMAFVVIVFLTSSVGLIFWRTHPISRHLPVVDSESAPLLNGPRDESGNGRVGPRDSYLSYVVVRLPFTMYFAWLCCATVVNFFIITFPIDPANPTLTIPIAQVTFGFLGLLSVVAMIVFREATFPLVIIWALSSIPYSSTARAYPGPGADAVAFTANMTAILVTLAVTLWTFVQLVRFNRRVEA
ncbi:hypothetical protein HDU97_002859 [Phlyctochytrium planicorne]|nr:hypothetical protein HDU97_002859 [Phlyctochytrium planicorne]